QERRARAVEEVHACLGRAVDDRAVALVHEELVRQTAGLAQVQVLETVPVDVADRDPGGMTEQREAETRVEARTPAREPGQELRFPRRVRAENARAAVAEERASGAPCLDLRQVQEAHARELRWSLPARVFAPATLPPAARLQRPAPVCAEAEQRLGDEPGASRFHAHGLELGAELACVRDEGPELRQESRAIGLELLTGLHPHAKRFVHERVRPPSG